MLMTTTHSSRPASPAISVQMMQSAIRKIPCKPSPIKLVCGRPWSEISLPPLWTTGSTHSKQEFAFQETLKTGFLPGEKQNVIDLRLPVPAEKRLFLQVVRLICDLPSGQDVSVMLGSTLRFDRHSKARLDLYVDPGGKIQAQILRNSPDGAGTISLVVEGNYLDVPAASR